jgi:hypothetical protein
MISDENALTNSTKNLLALNLWQFQSVLWTHISASNYLYPTNDQASDSTQISRDKSFIDNNNIWEAVFYNQLRRTDAKIKLESFFLFEWFPRSPGLFHTEQAKEARQQAGSRILKIENGIVVYDPYGKQSMLDGGVGNIRLKPINLNGMDYYFMSASSNGNCHEGFPVAVPVEYYNRHIDEIATRGAVVRTLIGKIRNIPKELEEIYNGNKEVPKFYLQIEDILAPSFPKSRHMEGLKVTVATSFVSTYEGEPKIYATYVTFDPAKNRSLREMVQWMENEYVKGLYKGKVLTDFDEIVNHFDDAPFSLKKVMNLELRDKDLGVLTNQLGLDPQEFLRYQHGVKHSLQEEDNNNKNQNKVFISYNHADQEIAIRIKNALQSEGLQVIIDSEAMVTGESIQEFINNCIRASGVTLSIISKSSLVSAWVAMETIYSRFDETIRGRKFLPVNVDKEFLRSEFTDESLDLIESELEKINRIRSKRILKNRGTEDLDPQITRYRRLQTELPDIIGKLRNSLCVDVSQDNFEAGMQKLIHDIKSHL